MKVYLLTIGGDYDDWPDNVGVFSSAEKAEEYKAANPSDDYNELKEFEIDAESGTRTLLCYEAKMNLQTGKLTLWPHPTSIKLGPDHAFLVSYFNDGNRWRPDYCVAVHSPDSENEAIRIANEKCLEWARLTDEERRQLISDYKSAIETR